MAEQESSLKGVRYKTGPWSESCILLGESSAGIVRSYEWPYPHKLRPVPAT